MGTRNGSSKGSATDVGGSAQVGPGFRSAELTLSPLPIRMTVREGRKIDTVLWAVLMGVGAATIYGGVEVMLTAQTCNVYQECSRQPYASWGLPLALIGLGLLLYGYASFVKSWGAWRPYRPEKYGVGDRANFDPVKAARAEVQARFLIIALLGLALATVEAFPIYALYQETANVPKPTFNPVAFALDIGVFAIADLLVLALAYVYLDR